MKRLFFLVLLFGLFTCKTVEEINPKIEEDLDPISTCEIIKHSYYTLAYSEENEQTIWVYYELIPELVNGTQSRTDDFREDPMVSTGSAVLEDYKGSGYDRGHLCPAANMMLNKTSMLCTSNKLLEVDNIICKSLHLKL